MKVQKSNGRNKDMQNDLILGEEEDESRRWTDKEKIRKKK